MEKESLNKFELLRASAYSDKGQLYQKTQNY